MKHLIETLVNLITFTRPKTKAQLYSDLRKAKEKEHNAYNILCLAQSFKPNREQVIELGYKFDKAVLHRKKCERKVMEYYDNARS